MRISTLTILASFFTCAASAPLTHRPYLRRDLRLSPVGSLDVSRSYSNLYPRTPTGNEEPTASGSKLGSDSPPKTDSVKRRMYERQRQRRARLKKALEEKELTGVKTELSTAAVEQRKKDQNRMAARRARLKKALSEEKRTGVETELSKQAKNRRRIDRDRVVARQAMDNKALKDEERTGVETPASKQVKERRKRARNWQTEYRKSQAKGTISTAQSANVASSSGIPSSSHMSSQVPNLKISSSQPASVASSSSHMPYGNSTFAVPHLHSQAGPSDGSSSSGYGADVAISSSGLLAAHPPLPNIHTLFGDLLAQPVTPGQSRSLTHNDHNTGYGEQI